MSKEEILNAKEEDKKRMANYFARNIRNSKNILNSDELLYKKNQKENMQSIKLSVTNSKFSFLKQEGKLDSIQDQMFIKRMLEKRKEEEQKENNSQKPDIKELANQAAKQVAGQVADQIKKKAKSAIMKNVVMPVLLFLFGPPLFLVEILFAFICICICVAGFFGAYSDGEKMSDDQISEICASGISREEASELEIDCK